MYINTKKIILIFTAILFLVGLYITPKILEFARWNSISAEAKAAASEFPMIFGLVNTMPIKCIPIEPAMNCPNHYLCAMKPSVECGQYTVISGQQAGGDGYEIILNASQYAMSGYAPGNSVIAGGLSAALIQVVATPGGCYGCQ
ncbi:MAG: hypothetical protein WC323_02495 [Patescibacteria group bacterium]